MDETPEPASALGAAPESTIEEPEAAVEKTKRKLAEYVGVDDIEDDSQPGKTEFVYRIKDKALGMGISQG